MKTTVFSTKPFEQAYLSAALGPEHPLRFIEANLSVDTAPLAQGSKAVAIFSTDDASAPVLEALHAQGVRFMTIRATGHDQVDLVRAQELGLRVANVPEYSPYAIAEHTLALMLALNRRLIRADRQLRSYDFRLDELIGFDLHGKTVGIIGLGHIGGIVAGILKGFGCRLLGYDPMPNPALTAHEGVTYTSLDQLCAEADIITLHAPMTPHAPYLIDAQRLALMKKGVMLINTSRGAELDTEAALAALDSGQLGYLGLDVYEHEQALFFQDHSRQPPADPLFARLLTYPNVLITGHQAFLTQEALGNIAATTRQNLDGWAAGEVLATELTHAAPGHPVQVEAKPVLPA
ncbi:2-hydroxyacid dehydrogenase [Hymenobacter sp. BT635]|uniref:2-hydroxyacid dehydrogenase n=1 Tax=Hymenobacter nitidus TaxID=2880929 RepID=A0ABS8ABV6_9BACT|nr:2-hydroxyacid dehydrogenase [Hymenobacter nitidus]MCB2377906.1 2-hydroxyacid dehydrogenase [Hymenobacter nitidus]